MTDDPAEVRRKIIDELIVQAEQNAAGHAELHETAVKHGRDDMAIRAQAAQTAWMEVRRILRMEIKR